jgi:hypothetical protein
MFDPEKFLACRKSLLIAPAGYGKTYAIASCLKTVKGMHLVLTHTNAGIASIYEKIKKLNVPASNYQIETISSFAQQLSLAFTDKLKLYNQESDKPDFKSIIDRAITLIQIRPIKSLISNSFCGLFVDEYQDCTIRQHSFIQLLTELFPTYLLGDPIQGIFNLDLNDPLVNMEDPELMGSFLLNQFSLDTPWRWINQGREKLGEDLKNIRYELERDKSPIIDFSRFQNIEFHQFEKEELYKPYGESGLKKIIYALLKSEKDILFIHSESAVREARIEYVKCFSNQLSLIESVDHKEFYSLSKTIDSFTSSRENVITNVYSVLIELFPKTDIEKWIQNDRIIKKRNNDGNEIDYKSFIEALEEYTIRNDNFYLARILEIIPQLIEKKSNFKEIYFSIVYALKKSSENSSTVYSEMVSHRNLVRRVGRKLLGKSIGTTLLTKGLECDTVVLLEETPLDFKNQYVALTRGCKRVVVLQIKNNRQRQKKEFLKPQETTDKQLSLW